MPAPRHHAEDQRADFCSSSRSAATPSESPTPVEAEAGAMPADDGLGFHDEENLRPAPPTRRSVVQSSRSKEFSFGRGRFRLRTATCCRRARIASARSLRLRKQTRTATRIAGMNSCRNSRFIRGNVPGARLPSGRNPLITGHHGVSAIRCRLDRSVGPLACSSR